MKLLWACLPVIVAFWPVWRWYFLRYCDSSDEPLGLVALVAALLLIWLRKEKARSPVPFFACGAATAIALYILSLPFAPQAVQAVFALVALLLYLKTLPTPFDLGAGEVSLMALSLPVLSTVSFYFGYPLRALTASTACVFLRLAGVAVSASGAELAWGRQLVVIDAPCSGVKMLWFSLFLAAAMAGLKRLDWLNTCLLLAGAVLLAILGNALRVDALFWLETGLLGISPGSTAGQLLHQSMSVVVFLVAACGLAGLAQILAREAEARIAALKEESRARAEVAPSGPAINLESLPSLRSFQAFCCLCAIAALAPRFQPALYPAQASVSFSGWPQTLEGRPLHRLRLSDATDKLLSNFPGQIAYFDCGSGRRVIIRWVMKETRQLHPSSDCFRGLGYKIEWRAPYVDEDGKRWQSFAAERQDRRLLVRERLYDNQGQSWSDVSAWWWSAATRKTTAPWWAITVAEPER